jgi:hypothetical protein
MSLSLQDRFELLDLYTLSTRLISDGDAEGWAGLFTTDGTFDIPAIEQFGAPPLSVVGHRALTEYIGSVIEGVFDEQMGLPKGSRKRYLVSNVLLEPDGDGARGSAYLVMLLVGQPDGPRLLGTGVYRDRFVKTREGWRIAERVLEPDG